MYAGRPLAPADTAPGKADAKAEDLDAGRAWFPPRWDRRRSADTEPAEAPEKRPGHPDIVGRYPDDYQRSDKKPPRVDGPHVSPEKWADAINPDKDAPGRDINCADCARCVDSTWHGYPAAAAALVKPGATGESMLKMFQWAGKEPAAASMADVERRLHELGPGSSAMIVCFWKTRGGHWFNAVNDAGAVKAADGQSGKIEAWPPSNRGLRFDESIIRSSYAHFFGPDGRVIRDGHPRAG